MGYLAAYVFTDLFLSYSNCALLDICLSLILCCVWHLSLCHVCLYKSLIPALSGMQMNLNSGCQESRLKPSKETLASSKISCVITRKGMQKLQRQGGRYRDRQGGSEMWRQVGVNFQYKMKNRKEINSKVKGNLY